MGIEGDPCAFLPHRIETVYKLYPCKTIDI